MDKTNIISGACYTTAAVMLLGLSAGFGYTTYKYVKEIGNSDDLTAYPYRATLISMSGGALAGLTLGQAVNSIVDAVKCFKH